MSYDGTITIINNSGKIISTGRQILNLFKEAKANYEDRKEVMRQARAAEAPTPLRRANTYAAPSRAPTYEVDEEDEEDDEVPEMHHALEYDGDEFDPKPRPKARLYIEDDNRSFISSRSHRSRHSHTSRSSRGSRSSRSTTSSAKRSTASSSTSQSTRRAATEVSAASSKASSDAYRSPYAETAPRDMQVSRAVLSRVESDYDEEQSVDPRSTSLMERKPMPVATRPADDDDDLAYGSVPPDLEERYDLEEWEEPGSPAEDDPAVLQKIMEDEREAKSLIRSVEKLLDEAQCMHHTASSIIEHLQGNPEAAAAVALTLAELSSILGKLSPSILGLIKGGSPAVFALLASPQFLIGATAVVGVTVVMFGGWRIIKKLQGEEPATKAAPMAMAAAPKPGIKRAMTMPAAAPSSPNSLVGSQPHEALVLADDDVASQVSSSIDSWRRGVPVFDDDAEVELISPHASRQRHRSHSGSGSKFLSEVSPDDSVSQIGVPRPPPSRSHRSSAMSSVSKTSSSASRSSNSQKSTKDSASSVSRSKSLSIAPSRGHSKLSSSMTPSQVSSGSSTVSSAKSSVLSSSSSKSSKVSSVAASKVPSRTSSKAGSTVSTSSSSSKHRDEKDKDRKEKREKRDDKDDSRSHASSSHRSSSSKSVVSTSGKSTASSSSSSSKKDHKKEEKKDHKKEEKKEEKKEDQKKDKKPNLLKSIFQKKKTDYSQSAVAA